MAIKSLDQMIGFIGGGLGVVIGALDLFATNIGLNVGSSYGSEIVLLYSLIGLFGAYLVTSRKKDAGLIMLIIGIAGLIAFPNVAFLSFVSAIPFVILIIAGIIARFL